MNTLQMSPTAHQVELYAALEAAVLYTADNNVEPEVLPSPTGIACPFPPAPLTPARRDLGYRTRTASFTWPMNPTWDPRRLSTPTLGRRDVVSTGPVNDFRLRNPSDLSARIRETNRRHTPSGRR